MRNRGWVLVVLAGCCALARPVPAQNAPGETAKPWRLSTAVGPAFALGKAGERWAKLIAEQSAGRLAVTAFPGAVLASRDPARELLVLKEGGADLAVGSSLDWSMQVRELGVIGLPWIAPRDAQLAALTTGAMRERLVAALDRAGVVALALVPLGHRELATTTRAIRAPEDLAGAKIRTTALPMLTEFYAGLRALPFAMPYAQAQAALKTGSLDGQDGSPAAFAVARLDAAGVRHVTLWNAVAEVAVFAVNRRVWDACSDADRALVRAAAELAARELGERAADERDAALTELAARGVALTRVTPAGYDAFAAAARGTYDRWAAVAGDSLTREAEAAVKAVAP